MTDARPNPAAPDVVERLESAFQEAGTGMAFLGLDGRFLQVNTSLCMLLGRSRPTLMAARIADVLHPDDVGANDVEIAAQLASGKLAHYETEKRFLREDGSVVWTQMSSSLIRDAQGEPAVYFCQIFDQTKRRMAEEALRDSEATLRLVLDAAPDGVILVDERGQIVSVNPQVERLFGYEPDEVVGEPIELLVPERLRDVHCGYRSSYLQHPRTRPMGRGLDLTARRKDGSEFPVEIGLGSVSGSRSGLVTCVITDITERKRAQEQVAHQATHDHLTGLANRALFLDRTELALARAPRSHATVAVLFIDLDRFKYVNDSLGHRAGDAVLTQTAARLRQVVRASDTVARFGGDEFAVLCEELHDPRETAVLAERILHALSAPIALGDREVVVTPSIGIALAGGSPVNPEGLVRDADAAMYRAKERGRSRYELFDEEMRARVVQRLDTENALRRALERNELRLHYQPIVPLTASGDGIAVEALLRWERDGQGTVAPNEFVPIAEETGLIVPMGEWVLQEACRQAAQWRDGCLSSAPLRVSVNLSAHQLARPDFVDLVAEALHVNGLAGSRLALEVTESSLMEDVESSVRMLTELKDLGVGISIDDFGTGYSSLSYLRRLPVDSIKVDRSFVDGLGSEADDSTIVAAVISLAHALGFPAVAEGVETDRQVEELRRLGCDHAQGYLFCRPLPAGEVERIFLA